MRSSLVPNSCFQPATCPARLRTANQGFMSGGYLQAQVGLQFTGVNCDSEQEAQITIPFACHNADMNHDIIISYPWLAAQGIDVIPRHQGLLVHRESDLIWCPGIVEIPTGETNRTNVSNVESIRDCTNSLAFGQQIDTAVVERLCDELDMYPNFDCFADAPLRSCKQVATSKEEVIQGFMKTENICWVNPPWSIWKWVEPYLLQGKCAGIILCPAWQKNGYHD